jgi:hypothetical protein
MIFIAPRRVDVEPTLAWTDQMVDYSMDEIGNCGMAFATELD